MSQNYQTIRETFARMRREGKARYRDIAGNIGISEGELIAAHVFGQDEKTETALSATRLRTDWPDIIESLEPLGEVMVLTRNDSCVHEKIGIYRGASHNGTVGLVLGGAIDLRVFYHQWAHGFAVKEEGNGGIQRSLQFFDTDGAAIHKVFMRENSVLSAYQDLVARFAHDDQSTGISVSSGQEQETEKPDDAIDIAGFRDAWVGLKDVHEFFGLLQKFTVSRTQGLRLADPKYVQSVDASMAYEAIEMAARQGVPIMVFAGNPGMIQIHAGPVHKVTREGGWINILDPDFNLHLRHDHIAAAWVVRKPTTDGQITSLELFDRNGKNIAMLFGERKPGKPELKEWRALIDTLCSHNRLMAG